MKFFEKILNYLLPPHCPICEKQILDSGAVCGECFGKLDFIPNSVCQFCGKPLPYKEAKVCASCLKKPPLYTCARSVLKYNEISKAIILPFKHADAVELAPLLSQWMNSRYSDLIITSDCLIPVPLHTKRLFKRKYNQSALLAKNLAKIHHKSYLPRVLRRTKNTQSQGHMNANKRQENIKNAFQVSNSQQIKNKNVLIIDDVLTTGATVNECTKVLLKAGAKQVNVLTLARVIKE